MTHGTRKAYQAGCTCLPCKAAEATYRAQLRRDHAKGHTPLGALVSATEARLRIRQLKSEGFTQADLAGRCGLRSKRLLRHTDRVRLRKLLTIRLLYRRYLMLGADGPITPLNPASDRS